MSNNNLFKIDLKGNSVLKEFKSCPTIFEDMKNFANYFLLDYLEVLRCFYANKLSREYDVLDKFFNCYGPNRAGIFEANNEFCKFMNNRYSKNIHCEYLKCVKHYINQLLTFYGENKEDLTDKDLEAFKASIHYVCIPKMFNLYKDYLPYVNYSRCIDSIINLGSKKGVYIQPANLLRLIITKQHQVYTYSKSKGIDMFDLNGKNGQKYFACALTKYCYKTARAIDKAGDYSLLLGNDLGETNIIQQA